jgi:preprotein translocase subunit SecA
MNAMAPSSSMAWSKREARLPPACTLAPLEQLPEGLDAQATRWQGWLRRHSGTERGLWASARAAAQACADLDGASDDVLTHALMQARAHLCLDPLQAKGQLAAALGAVGQMARRTMGMSPYTVQYMGALALHQGLLAEMATGEGKTLTVAMAGVLAGLTGRPCHVLTVNDYLAQRDADSMRALYQACGVSVQSVTAEVESVERGACYGADVVYLTAKELLADHLRDQLALQAGRGPQQWDFQCWLSEAGTSASAMATDRLQWRGLHTAIVDEADSILVDEAVTPLILAAPRDSRGLAQAVQRISEFANSLQREVDYQVVLRAQAILLQDSARAGLAQLTAELPEVWRPAPRREELLRQALLVRHFYHAGEHYLLQDGEVVLLDTFTGRLTPGRSLTAGLHQAIEAFEGVSITEPNESLTQMSFQAFFRRFRRLCGCSGTVWEAADELWGVYGLQVVRIPTHRPRIVFERSPQLMPDQSSKWQAVVADAVTEIERGRPVLVGVRSVTASETLAQHLRAAGLLPQVLNALSHAQEADIIAQAGQPGRVTIATNMAGRGTDIRLGEGVAERGGLHVIIAEINDSARVDRQLAGRCGRQGDPGSVSLYLSLDDPLAERQLGAVWHRLLRLMPRHRWAAYAFRRAQIQAELESFARRLSVLRNDDWMASALPFESRHQGALS